MVHYSWYDAENLRYTPLCGEIRWTFLGRAWGGLCGKNSIYSSLRPLRVEEGARVKDFVLEQIYSTAALVEEAAHDPESMIELAWDTPSILSCLARYQRIALLHYYIYAMILVHMRPRRNKKKYSRRKLATRSHSHRIQCRLHSLLRFRRGRYYWEVIHLDDPVLSLVSYE